MKKIPLVKLGRHCQVADTATLGEVSGRKSVRLKSLTLGNDAHIRSASVLYSNTLIGHHFETGHGVVIREENKLGHHVCIWNYSTIDYGCVIGNRVKIHSQVYIAQYSVIEDDVFIGPGTVFANDLFPKSRHAEKVMQGPIIKRGAVLGAHCTILPGVVIGEKALIGAGSVVTHDIPARMVAWGNPAQVSKEVKDLRWPDHFPIKNAAALAFYRRRLAGLRAFH